MPDVNKIRDLAQKILDECAVEAKTELNAIYVKKGDSIQKAVDAAPQGAVIRVFPDEYEGITLKGRTANITIRPDTDNIPKENERVSPDMSAGLIKLRPTAGPTGACIATEQGADGYTLIGIQCLPGRPEAAMCELGSDKETDPLRQPKNIMLDRMLAVANPATGGKRCVAANTGAFNLLNSHIDGFWWKDDSQGVQGANGPGPFRIENNFIRATGENILFGGADSKSEGCMPRNLIARGNTLSKNLEWRGLQNHTVKNVFELKAMISATVENNIIENCWVSGQVGYAVLFTPRNQNGLATWTQVMSVVFQHNIIRHAAGGFSVMGDDNLQQSRRTTDISILNNLIYDIDPKAWGLNGKMLLISRGPVNVEFAFNTCLGQSLNSFLSLEGPTRADRLNIHDNVLTEGGYGITGSGGIAPGKDAWDMWTQNSEFEANIIQRGTARKLTYPGISNLLTPAGEPAVGPDMKLLPSWAFHAGAPVDDILRLTKASL